MPLLRRWRLRFLEGEPKTQRERLESARRKNEALRERLKKLKGEQRQLRRALRHARSELERAGSQREETKERLREARARSAAFARAYRKLAEDELGVSPTDSSDGWREPPTPEQLAEVLRAARRLRAETTLVELLGRGQDLDAAAVSTIRALLSVGARVPARALAQALLHSPATEQAGHAALALVAVRQRLWDLAGAHLQALPRELWRRLVPAEYLDIAFSLAPELASEELAGFIEEPVDARTDEEWFAIATVAYGAGEVDGAARLLLALDERRKGTPDLPEQKAAQFAWLARWVRSAREPRRRPALPAGEGPLFAIIDYKQPDFWKTSRDLGDYVQTLAAIGQLARFEGVRYVGDDGLGDFVTGMQRRVCEERRLGGPPTTARLVPVNRDITTEADIPEGTWMIACGWYSDFIFERRFAFPLHRNLRPIFISFQVRREMLTEEALVYLRRYAPIGCRDWTTVFLLHSAGVPAFFSGCLTTTIDTLFDPADELEDCANGSVAVVDARAEANRLADGEKAVRMTQVGGGVREAPIVQNLEAAVALLEGYRSGHSRIITSRLHCYIPATALGLDVDFQPPNLADPRFDGLLGLAPDSEPLRAMRTGILDKLEAVIERILASDPEEAVYARWRRLCEADVAAARERLQEPYPVLRSPFPVAAECERIRASRRDFGPVEATGESTVDVALALDGNLRDALPIAIEGIVTNTARRLHLWILTRGLRDQYFERLADDFSALALTFLPCDAVQFPSVTGRPQHITMSAMDRLLLPELLPTVSRIVYLDVDTLTLGDIGELYDTELEGFPLAARSSRLQSGSSGFHHVWRAASRLSPKVASELRRRMHTTFRFDFRVFYSGTMVLDLERMREDEFCERYIPWVERYRMTEEPLLNCYLGPDRKVLPKQWNAFPSQEIVEDPKLIHWIGPIKPWDAGYVPLGEIWDRYEHHYRHRTGRIAEDFDGVERDRVGLTPTPQRALASQRARSWPAWS
jgi:lipopolysaccharide biosynthesis glycosyltransferase